MTLYSNNCPKCIVLKKKLSNKNILYEDCNDLSIIKDKGFTFLPILEVKGVYLNFSQAIEYINKNF